MVSPMRTPPSTRTSPLAKAVRGQAQVGQRADRRQEALLRVLGVDARLDGMAIQAQFVLGGRQRLAGGHAQLPFDQVMAGDHFGDRVLHLQPGIHFHEVEAAVGFGDELDGARAYVATARAAATAASPMARRRSSVMPGAGASSMTFWWRRCTEQSRSNR